MNRITCILLVTTLLLAGCQGKVNDNTEPVRQDPAPLAEAYEGMFRIGVALNSPQVGGEIPQATPLITKHFNSITPENLLKWESVHPEPGRYSFDAAGRYVDFGERHEMFIVGHTLVWHSQVPDWTFEDENGDEIGREALLQRMEDHITTVAGRYEGRVDAWDVVNEAVLGADGMRQSKWYTIIGEEFIDRAFRYAHQADPDAELYYNDYNLWQPEKRQAVVEMVERLQSNDVPIDGIGMQSHLGIDGPPAEQVEASIEAFSELGLKVMITELDIDVLPAEHEVDAEYDPESGEEVPPALDPYSGGLPDSVQQQLTDRYVELFELFKKHRDKIDRVTFWGLHDGQSWLNYFPIRSRTNYPLLFDRNYEPKPALFGILDLAGE